MTGKLVRKRDEKGFGFIRDERGQEYFVHHTLCSPECAFHLIEVGEELHFEPDLTGDPKGPRALNVRKP